MQRLATRIKDAASWIEPKTKIPPKVGMILGTGLGGLARQIEVDVTLPYDEIPHFPVSTVESHASQLVCGSLSNVPLVAMEGRFHFYEGYTMQQITFPVRVMKELGAEILLVTNAAGGINTQYDLADIIILEDHINLMCDNPLIGENDDSLGPRFPDMSHPYDPELIQIARKSALELAIQCYTGVFVAVAGPNLETRAEYRMLKTLGADVVGMSTVPEILVANHVGVRALAFSVITDMCLPDALEPVELEKIIEVAGRGGEKLSRLIPRILEQI